MTELFIIGFINSYLNNKNCITFSYNNDIIINILSKIPITILIFSNSCSANKFINSVDFDLLNDHICISHNQINNMCDEKYYCIITTIKKLSNTLNTIYKINKIKPNLLMFIDINFDFLINQNVTELCYCSIFLYNKKYDDYYKYPIFGNLLTI